MKSAKFVVAAMIAALVGAGSVASADPITYTLNLTNANLPGHTVPAPKGPAPVPSGTINGAIFARDFTQPAGTGNIDPFVRIQMNGQESGYNTTGKIEFETKDMSGHNWNQAVRVGEVGSVSIGGSDYLQFWLDLNESNGGKPDKHLLSMFEFEIYLDKVSSNSNYLGPTSLGTKVYDMDAVPSGNSTVVLDHDLMKGSGKFDMVVSVPKVVFGTDPTKYLYLYTSFGDPWTKKEDAPDLFYESDAGFEEWAFRRVAMPGPTPGPTPVPVPAAVWGGMGLFGMIGARRWLRRR